MYDHKAISAIARRPFDMQSFAQVAAFCATHPVNYHDAAVFRHTLTTLVSGPAAVIDIRRKTGKDPDYRLAIEDIRAWEKAYGRLTAGAIVLIHCGWGKYWGDRKRYFGTDEPGNVTDLHFPGLSPQAAEFLVKQRRVKAVGIDTPSIDHGPSIDFSAHQILGAANVPIFENVARLETVPRKGATVFAIPMKIKGGSGAPLRIFGLLP